MAVFVWEAKNKSGQPKKGEMEGTDAGTVSAILRKQGYTDIRAKQKVVKSAKGRKIEEMDVVIFTRQMSTMVAAGMPLVQCFDLAARGAENPAQGEVLARVRDSISAGTPLADAMAAETKMFDELFINLTRAGEQSGILDKVLARLAIYKEKSAVLKGKIKSAMTYPIAVVSIALIVTGVLMIFVVPVFGALFKDFGAELPAPTRVVIAMSDWVVVWWWLVLIAIGGFVWGFKFLYRTNENFHYQMDGLSLNLPIFGLILRKAAVARFARTFATMISAGTPILECLQNVAKTSGNRVVEEAIMNSMMSISEGRSLTEPLADSGIFPVMVTQMISIGESTGALDTMLEKIADFYEAEVDRAVDTLSSLIEPLILVFLGTVIGGLVVAMYMPIFQMGNVV